VTYDLSRVKVLYVEKHLYMRGMVHMVLSTLGIREVRDTDDPGLAYDMFLNDPPDIVICDWSPGLDGLAFLDRVRAAEKEPERYVPFIIVSAHTEREHVLAARDHGMTEFLGKPFSARLLYDRICTIIEHPRPFVEAEAYFGPERRRRKAAFDGERRGGGESGRQIGP
jgi:DNA-binding response OmpR family regulator